MYMRIGPTAARPIYTPSAPLWCANCAAGQMWYGGHLHYHNLSIPSAIPRKVKLDYLWLGTLADLVVGQDGLVGHPWGAVQAEHANNFTN